MRNTRMKRLLSGLMVLLLCIGIVFDSGSATAPHYAYAADEEWETTQGTVVVSESPEEDEGSGNGSGSDLSKDDAGGAQNGSGVGISDPLQESGISEPTSAEVTTGTVSESASQEEGPGTDTTQTQSSSEAVTEENSEKTTAESTTAESTEGTAGETGEETAAEESTAEETTTEETTTEETTTEETVTEETAGLMMAGSLLFPEEEDSLQNIIDQAGSEATVTLEQDYTENIIIEDGKVLTVDLNGHSITADDRVRTRARDLNVITVYGSLTLKDSADGGAIKPVAEGNSRGVYVDRGGSFRMEGGAVTGHHASGSGGGIYVSGGGSFTMEGGAIESNQTDGNGGGIFAYSGGGLALKSGSITDNRAENGGGLAVYTPSEEEFTLNSADIIIKGNEASENGGALFMPAGSNLIISGGSFSDNSAQKGGGLFVDAGSTVTLSGGEITGNQATAAGGGLYLASSSTDKSTFILKGGQIADNGITEETDNTQGGGAAIGEYAQIMIGQGTVVKNNANARQGGGISAGRYTVITMDGGQIVNNSTDGNAAAQGGGLHLANGGGVTITGGEIGGNHSYSGGGVFSSSDVEVLGGKICDNTASGDGGGIQAGERSVKIAGTAVMEGNVSGGNGGGVKANTVSLEGAAAVQKNEAVMGGGVYSGKTAVMTGGSVCDNYAVHGGGIYTCGGSILGGLISGNDSGYSNGNGKGGGVNLQGPAELVIGGTAEIRENTAASGGGVYVGNGALTVSGGLITANGAKEGGGILYASSSAGKLTLTAGLVYNNRADNAKEGKDIKTAAPAGKLAAAGGLKEEGLKIAGSAWYDEQSDTREYKEVTLSGRRVFTFLYNEAEEAAVARIGEVSYPSVQAAVDAAKGGAEGAVAMLADSRESVTVPAGAEPSPEEPGPK